MNSENFSKEELQGLDHNDHRKAFQDYLQGRYTSRDKHSFLFSWVSPQKNDMILECGSSSGKTCIDFSRRSDCYCLGIDFDPQAIQISGEMRDTYFPELKDRCFFKEGDLENMQIDNNITKILMPDFTEHIPDHVFSKILENIKKQLPNVRLYIYTPLRSHIFEIMKHKNLILKKPSGHINVKTEKELIDLLETNNWSVESIQWRPSHIPLFRFMELFLGHIPVLGILFRRRIAVIAVPKRC